MKIVAQSLGEQVYELIKQEILKGNMKCGEKIREDQLAEQFGVSRTPIREALTRLAEYGLITLAPRSHSSVVKITEQGAKDIGELRVSLEQFAIDHINMDIFNKMLSDILKCAEDCKNSLAIGEKAKAFELDSLFHIYLMQATGNDALVDVYIRLDAKIQLLRINQNLALEPLSAYINQHVQLVGQIMSGNLEAAKELVKEHITHEKMNK